MPDFENVCKDRDMHSSRDFYDRMSGMSNQCIEFSKEDYQKLREFKAEDISWPGEKIFADSQNTICARKNGMQKPAKSNQTGVSADYSPDEILLEGNVKNSAFVLEIQDRLRKLGYLDKGGVDGIYAEMHRDKSMGQTASAILRFQQDHNIEPTGKVDVLTFTALYQASPETTAGMLAGAFESPSKGMDSIGWDERGGTSYGRFQFASRSGIMDSFVKYLRTCDAKANALADRLEAVRFERNRKDKHSEDQYEKAKKDLEDGAIKYEQFSVIEKEYKNKRYLNRYDAGKYVTHAPNTPIDEWIALSKELEPYAEKFVENKYYILPLNVSKQKYPTYRALWDMIDNSSTLKEVFISVSIQHGQNEVGTHFIIIYNNAIRHRKINKPIDSSELIREVYNYRRMKFPNNSNRYDREQAMAIDMLRLEIEKEQCKSSEE